MVISIHFAPVRASIGLTFHFPINTFRHNEDLKFLYVDICGK